MTSTSATTTVVVAILTFRRPDDLAAVVPQVARQVRDLGPQSSVLVVDNDPAGSAREAVERLSAEWPVRYVHEPEPGIAAARNRAIDDSADVDYLVFIDDDERPREGWLRSLMKEIESGGVIGVAGPVISRFDSEVDPWIVAGGFFDRRRVPTGTRVRLVATNNLILDLRRLRSSGVRFDNRFGLTGGSDTLFSLELGRRGFEFGWCDEAVVEDVVPPARLTREWVLRRARRTGNSWVRTSLASTREPLRRIRVRARFVAHGSARILAGAVRVALGALTSSMSQRARGRRTIARGAGILSGACGGVVAEYRRA